MGSSTSGKKNKKDKKHSHRSRSQERQRDYEEDDYDMTGGDDSSGRHRHHKHKKHKEHKHKHHHKHREQHTEVIALEETDSDSSDCVEVPVDYKPKDTNRERELSTPPPPQISKHADYERDRERDRDRERERESERERERERERDYEREREREREREYERERERDREYERERERERERDRERERARERDRERERDRYERDREMERRRDKGAGAAPFATSERSRMEREREREMRKRNAANKDRSTRERSRSNSKSYSPIPDNGAGDCLSIEQTNKLRAKLGLKPLELDSGPVSKPASGSVGNHHETHPAKKQQSHDKDLASYKDEWGEFLHKPAVNINEKKEGEKLREKLKQHKEKRFLDERLTRIRTLGESDEEGDDVSKWVKRNKKITDEKREAEKRAKALEEMDAEFGVHDLVERERQELRRHAYSDKHLKGLRVEHDMDDFTEGKQVILTLKDKDVLNEEDDDALVNVNMVDEERYRRNVINKKQNPLSYGYNVYEEQYDHFGNLIERGVLEKYDDEIAGKEKRKNFVIGENIEQDREQRRKLLEIKTKLAGKRLETLEDTNIQLASDTFSTEELAKFKKPKRKVKKLRQKLKADDLLDAVPSTSMNFGSRNGRYREIGDVDDLDMDSNASDGKFKVEEEEDDLQRVLSKARKLKQKETIIKHSLNVNAESIKQEIKMESNEDDTTESGLDGNIVLNATAEFCRTLGDIPTYGMAGNRNEEPNDMIDYELNDDAGEDRLHVETKYEEPELNHGTWNSVNPDEIMQPADLDNLIEDVEERAILDEEPDVGAGVANALRLALSKGYLEKEESNRPSNSKMAHLQAKNYSIEDKAAGEDDKFGRRDRYHAGPIMEFKDKDTFKPNVKLEYIDDNGRILNLKEAFRYLSHKFHGKGPGKNKIEKRLKKMEQDGLMKTMSSTDTPLCTLTMLQQKQKETKTPYVVLSGSKQSTSGVSGSAISKFK